MANIINYAATGEMLDPGQYSPVKGDKYSPIGIGYNSGFMAPEVPFLNGRNNMPVSVDLMGQLDTVFRLLDPQGFIEARENVLPRAALSQLEGEDFFGRPLKGPKERIGQAASDIFEPIGASQIRGALNIGPDNEGRIGDTGQAIQATGFNLRGEPTATMKDRFAKERFNGRGWDELSVSERDTLLRENEPFRKELEARRDEAVANGSDSAARQLERANVITELTTKQQASDTLRSQGVLDPEQWRRDYQARKDEYRLRNDQIWAGLEFKPGKDTVLNGFYSAMDAAEGPDGKINWDKVDAYRATLSAADNQHIDENTGLIRIDTPAVREFEAVRDRIEASGYFDRLDENWHNVAYYVPTWDGDGRLPQPVNPKDFAHYEDWRNAALKVALDSVGATLDDIGTVTQINAWLNQQKPAEGMEAYGKKWTDQWSWENQEVAYEAWRYGYYNPRKAIKEGLAAKFE
jgi:hypothetical protein